MESLRDLFEYSLVVVMLPEVTYDVGWSRWKIPSFSLLHEKVYNALFDPTKS